MDKTHLRNPILSCLLGAALLSLLLWCSSVPAAASPGSAGVVLTERLQQGVRAASSATDGLVVVSYSDYRVGDYIYIVGEARNDSATNVHSVLITAYFLDEAGGVLGTACPVPTEHDIILPGQISPFVIFEACPAGLASYSLVIQGEPTEAVPVPPLSVLSVRELPNPSGGLAFVGELQNTHTVTVSNAKLIVTLYDASGTVVNVQSDYAFSNLLVPGQKSPFRLVLSDGPASYARRQIGVDTRESAATPPDLHSASVVHHVDGTGVLHWSGEVQNRRHTEARIVKAMVTLYDDAGDVVNCGVSDTNPSIIGPGSAASFDIVVHDNWAGWSSYAFYPPEDVVPTPTASPSPTATAMPSATPSATATPTPTTTETPRPTATMTATPTPSATATATYTPTASPTATKTPPGDLRLTGYVFDAALGPSSNIGGALISVLMCVARPYTTYSAMNGCYELLLPAMYLNACVSVTLEASATGYQPFGQLVAVADLRAQPHRDFPLLPLATPTATPTSLSWHTYLPLVCSTVRR